MIDAERILQETYPDFKFGKDNKLVVQALKKTDPRRRFQRRYP